MGRWSLSLALWKPNLTRRPAQGKWKCHSIPGMIVLVEFSCFALCQSLLMFLNSSFWEWVTWYQLTMSVLYVQWQAVQGDSRPQFWSGWPGTSFWWSACSQWRAWCLTHSNRGSCTLLSIMLPFFKSSVCLVVYEQGIEFDNPTPHCRGFDMLQMRWQVLRQKAVNIKQDYSDVTSAVSYCHLISRWFSIIKCNDLEHLICGNTNLFEMDRFLLLEACPVMWPGKSIYFRCERLCEEAECSSWNHSKLPLLVFLCWSATFNHD